MRTLWEGRGEEEEGLHFFCQRIKRQRHHGGKMFILLLILTIFGSCINCFGLVSLSCGGGKAEALDLLPITLSFTTAFSNVLLSSIHRD